MRLSRAERAREQISRRYPYEPCGACKHGWVITDAAKGIARRCLCWTIHQAKVKELIEQTLEQV